MVHVSAETRRRMTEIIRPTHRFALCAMLLLAACAQDVTGPDRAGEPLQTEKVSYEARVVGGSGNYTQYGFTVVATFRNLMDQTVYLGRCYPDSPTPIYGIVAVDTDDDWGAAYSPGWACVGHDQEFAIAPGGTRTDTLHISGPNAWDGHTKEPFGVLEGRFRIIYDVRLCRDCATLAPVEMGRSNLFDVRVQAS